MYNNKQSENIRYSIKNENEEKQIKNISIDINAIYFIKKVY